VTKQKSSKRFLLGALALAALMSGLGFAVGHDWGYGAAFAASVYAVLVSVFLAAQLYGFVLSQVKYSESVEATKFQVLEAEEIEWRRRP
jgi:hypothetical protein